MADINQCTFTGHLGRDPDKSGGGEKKTRVTFSMAVNGIYIDAEGVKRETATWLNFVAFDAVADFCYQYLKKGSLAVIVSKVQIRKYTGRDGNEKTSQEYIIQQITAPGSARPAQDAKPATTAPEQDSGNQDPEELPIGPTPAYTKLPDKPKDTRTQDQLFDSLGKPVITDDDIPF